MSVEKAIAAGIEPVLDMMVEIETRVKQVEARAPIPGPPADPETVANMLMELYGDTLKGEPGQPGADGNSISLYEVAELVAKEYQDQLRGPPGDSPDISTIADQVFEVYGSRLKGDPGRDGDPGEDAPEVDLEAVADLVHVKYGDVLKGEPGLPGKDGLCAPLPVLSDIAELVIEEYGPTLKGDQGEPGFDGIGINAPVWEAKVYRDSSIVQHHFGQYFRALKDTAEEPGKSSDWERIGKAGFRWTGLKVAGRDYQDGDWYIDNGTTFMFLDGKGRMIAKRGDVGKTGEKGDKGDAGPAAPMIAEILFDEKGIVVALDNGTVLEAKSEGLESYVVDRINKATEGLENALVILAEEVKALSEEVKGLRKAKR